MRYSVPQLERMARELDAEIKRHQKALQNLRRHRQFFPVDLSREINMLNDAQSERREVAAALRMKKRGQGR
jgi:Skp family chaperone for outer membrane proteins